MGVSDACADACNIIENFTDGVEPIVAFGYDESRGLARDHMGEEIVCPGRNRMRMGGGQERPSQRLLGRGDAACHMRLLHQSGGQCVEKFVRAEAVVVGIG